MGWAAVTPATGELVVADAFESKIDKFIRQQKKKGIKLIKRHFNYSVPSKRKLNYLKEMYGQDKVNALGMIKK